MEDSMTDDGVNGRCTEYTQLAVKQRKCANVPVSRANDD